MCEVQGGERWLHQGNQGTESTAGHHAQGKLKQKVTHNLYMLIDLPWEDKHSLAENLLNVWSQGDSFTQENSLVSPPQINQCWGTQNILLSYLFQPSWLGDLETWGIKQDNQIRAGQSICLCLQHFFWPLDILSNRLILYKVIPFSPIFTTPISYAWNPVIPTGFSNYSKMKTIQTEKSCWKGEVKMARN